MDVRPKWCCVVLRRGRSGLKGTRNNISLPLHGSSPPPCRLSTYGQVRHKVILPHWNLDPPESMLNLPYTSQLPAQREWHFSSPVSCGCSADFSPTASLQSGTIIGMWLRTLWLFTLLESTGALMSVYDDVLGISWRTRTRELFRSGNFEFANCSTSESNVFYSADVKNPDCFAQWRVDITANVTHEDGTTAIVIFYDKAALAEADAGSWVDCNHAWDELNDWPIGQNYTCWFNPDEIKTYPTIPEVAKLHGMEADDYNNYAWFDYYPGELDASVDFWTLGLSLLVLLVVVMAVLVAVLITLSEIMRRSGTRVSGCF
ncbi:hypothetical protein Pelo_3232 [Pelomyxa schiedti]|nr:hypothetical protein Pelo_3232 [Pelomyxa schiedti]